ncbi:PE-PPE domain-containing protein [Mycobacterium sp. E740]|uniref:PE-PPE domain-containing protein n=1 Tax=Mycobacterium sp. E740 TaxID=1834149 RepID=UPI0007FEA3D1|nr:PE-PPE domain-containing protein [Mycobacterium sp. E740]OBI81898.1 hypothetical protein A5663_15415 [Mycobacterium sp. E740]
MRKWVRVLVLSLLGLLSTAVLGAVTAVMAAVSLAATALIVPGTGTPNANIVGDYMQNFRDYYMQDTPCTNDQNCGTYDPQNPLGGGLHGIDYFASFWPIPLPGWCDPGRCEKFDKSVDDGVQNLDAALQALQDLGYDGDIVIAGYSQGARVVTIEKMKFASGEWADLLDQVSFVYIGNPNRPNGGILSRFGALGHIPILDVTTGQPTPTSVGDVGVPTEDWAIRWEGIADFPQYLLNPLAVVNSLMGFYYDHGTYLAINENSDPGELPAGYDVDTWRDIVQHPENYPDIVDIQKYGDTTYYTITPKVLPLVRPLHSIPIIGKPIADLIEPALRVLIEETGYNRNIPFGQPTEIGLLPLFNPFTLALKLIPAIFQGINNFLANFGLATEIPLSPTTPRTTVSPLTGEQNGLNLLAKAVEKADESSGARLQLVQGNGEGEQQQAGENDGKTLASTTEKDGQVTLTVGNEALGAKGAVEAGQQQGTTTGNVETVNGTQASGTEATDTEAAGTQATGTEVVGTQTTGTQTTGTQATGTQVTGTQATGTQATGTQANAGEGTKEVKEGEGHAGVSPVLGNNTETNKETQPNTINANGGSVSLNFSPNKTGEGATTSGGEHAGQSTPAAAPEAAGTPESGSQSTAGAEKPAA